MRNRAIMVAVGAAALYGAVTTAGACGGGDPDTPLRPESHNKCPTGSNTLPTRDSQKNAEDAVLASQGWTGDHTANLQGALQKLGQQMLENAQTGNDIAAMMQQECQRDGHTGKGIDQLMREAARAIRPATQ
jgi:hypothetical protein